MENERENNEEKKTRHALRAEWIVIIAVFFASLGAFALWGFSCPHSIREIAAAALVLLLFTLGLLLAVPNAFSFFKGIEEERGALVGDRTGRRGRMHPILGVMLMALASRVILYITAYVILLIAKGYTGTFFNTLETIWLRDPHDLVGYGLFGAEFVQNSLTLPLYPLIIKGLDFLTGSSFVSGLIVSTLASMGAAALIYELVLSGMGKRSAKMAVFFMFAMPASIFFAVPNCCALFTLLVCASLLFMRKGRFIFAGIFGMLASFTHIWGILLVVPYIAEAVNFTVRQYKSSGKQGLWKVILKAALSLLLIPLGLFGCMLFTRFTIGDWFALFGSNRVYLAVMVDPLTYAAYLTDVLITRFGTSNTELLGFILPCILYLFGALVLFIASARTLRTSYTLWFIACFAVCGFAGFGTLPVLFTATLAAPLALTHLCDSKDDGSGAARALAKAAAAGGILILGQLLYLIMFVIGYPV